MSYVHSDHAFRLRHRISHADQNAIIEYIVKNGYDVDSIPIWHRCDIHSLDFESVSGMYVGKPVPSDFYFRMWLDAEWHWEDTWLAEKVQELVRPVRHLFTKFTRIKAVVQRPGTVLNPHRDLATGNVYKHLRGPYNSKLGRFTGVYQGRKNVLIPANTRHRDQKYLNLKIPLSVHPTDPGPLYIMHGEEKQYLDAQGHYFFLQEYPIFHGCEASDFHRGVILVDGLLNMEAVEEEYKLNFEAG